MRSYNVFFFSVLFFLIGILLASAGFTFSILVGTLCVVLLFLLLWFFGEYPFVLRFHQKRKYWIVLALLSFFIIGGALYYQWDDLKFQNTKIIFDKKIQLVGTIVSNPELKGAKQNFILELEGAYTENILVSAQRYPEFAYGDSISITGTVRKPSPEPYALYLAKERVSGVLAFGDLERIGTGEGSKIQAFLYQTKRSIIETFQKILPGKEAAFLSGLTLGERGEFSKEFSKAMQVSGTTHLVALSGYNITILVWAVLGVLTVFLRRRIAFFGTVFAIVAFAAMTGAEASVVRAAIMGILVLIATEVGKMYDMRNALAAAALCMVLQNPKVLVFDVGFQLSFLALMGIVYLKPVLSRWFHMKEKVNIFSWKENVSTTLAAQLFVLPVLVMQFSSVSPVSLISNILVLEFIPITMGLGFLTAGFGFLWDILARVFGLFAWVFLSIEIGLIEFFGKLNLSVEGTISVSVAILYYVILIFILIYDRRRYQKTYTA